MRQQRYPARSQLRTEAEAFVQATRVRIERELRFLVLDLKDCGAVECAASPIVICGTAFAHDGAAHAHRPA